MKCIKIIGLFALLASATMLSAQITNLAVTNAVLTAVVTTNAVTAIGPVPLPTTALDYWDLAIGALSPIVVWALSLIVPKIPRAFLPALTPVVGIGLGLLVNWLASQNMSWFEAAKAGAMAVFFREMTNQWVTKRLTETQPAEPTVLPGPGA